MKRKITIASALFVFLFFGVSLFGASSTKAQNNQSTCVPSNKWWAPTNCQFLDKVNGVDGTANTEIFGERYTYAQVDWIIQSLVGILGGPIPSCANSTRMAECIGKQVASSGGGPVLQMMALSDTIKNTRPVSGISYVAEKLDQLHIVSPAYAQTTGGYGFTKSLLPIQPIWVATRNAAFAMTTFAIIILAFMIMFRAKISPQAVITAQSALPKVAIGLLFITFSYAIAGFMVDLAFVIQGVIAAIVSASGISTFGPIQIFNQIQDGLGSIFSFGAAFMVESFTGSGLISTLINPSHSVIFTIGTAGLFTALDVLIAALLLIVLLIAAVRILWLFILTYSKVIFLVIGGPFVALLSIVGQGGGVGGWIKKLASELGVFVAIGVLVMFAHIIFYQFGNGGVSSAINNVIHVNPYGIKYTNAASLAGAGAMPTGFSYGNNVSLLGLIVSLAIMVSVPKLASAFRDQIATGRGAYGFGIGEAVSPVAGLAGMPLGRNASTTEAMARAAGVSPYALPGRGTSYGVNKAAQWILGKASKM